MFIPIPATPSTILLIQIPALALIHLVQLEPVDLLLHQLESTEENCVDETATAHADTKTAVHAAIEELNLGLLGVVGRTAVDTSREDVALVDGLCRIDRIYLGVLLAQVSHGTLRF